jgi:phosphate transport system protein
MPRPHTDRAFEAELEKVRAQILLMEDAIDEMMASSVRALVERDAALARRMIAMDHQVNRIEIDTDGLCVALIARRQPVASDLRFVTLTLKLVTDLERVGDLCVKVSERAIDLASEALLEHAPDLRPFGELVRQMIKDGVRAFAAPDVMLARSVIERDRQVDALAEEMRGSLMRAMEAEPSAVRRGSWMHSVVSHVERMGDHATNVAELAILRAEGEDVRHAGRVA